MGTGDDQVGGLGTRFMQDNELPAYYFNDFGIYKSPPLAANDFSGLEDAGHMSGGLSVGHFQPGWVQNTTFGLDPQPYPFQDPMDSGYVKGCCFVPAPTIVLTTASSMGKLDAQNYQFCAGGFPGEPGGLFPSTLQLATEPAQCMNTSTSHTSPLGTNSSQLSSMPSLALNYPPTLDNSSSPSISHTSGSDDDPGNGSSHFYNLPGSLLLVTHQKDRSSAGGPGQSFPSVGKYMSKEDCLTPLEMPDGSIRLTANWLPVDPEGGFTIADPGMADEVPSSGAIFDVGPPHYGEDVFFNADSALSTLGV